MMNKYIRAVTELDQETVRQLVEEDTKWLSWSEPSGKNALHYLCGVRAPGPQAETAALEILKFLLKKGMDINSIHRIDDKSCNYFPGTPLWYAYTRGRKERLYKYLLKQGADPNNCMWAIAWYDDIPAAKLFIRHGARIEEKPSWDDLFLGAFGWKKFDFAYWLLSMGADVNAADAQGNTALMVAVKRKDAENISRLIKAHADPDRKNQKGESARSIANIKGPKRLLNLL